MSIPNHGSYSKVTQKTYKYNERINIKHTQREYLKEHVVGCHGDGAAVEHHAVGEQREEVVRQHAVVLSAANKREPTLQSIVDTTINSV